MRNRRPKITLQKVYNGWPDGGGVFSTMERLFPVPWEGHIDGQTLDMEYYGNHSGSKLISPLIEKLLVPGEGLTPERQETVAKLTYLKFNLQWTGKWNTMFFEYNPIENYNMIEKENREGEHSTSRNTTGSRSETVTYGKKTKTSNTGNITDTRNLKQTGTETTNDTRGKTGTDTRKNTGTETYEHDKTTTNTGTDTLDKTGTLGQSGSTQTAHGHTVTDSGKDTLKKTGTISDSGSDSITYGKKLTEGGTDEHSKTGTVGDSGSDATQHGHKITEGGDTIETVAVNGYNGGSVQDHKTTTDHGRTETHSGTDTTTKTNTTTHNTKDTDKYGKTETESGTDETTKTNTTTNNTTDEQSFGKVETHSGTDTETQTNTDTYNLKDKTTHDTEQAENGTDTRTDDKTETTTYNTEETETGNRTNESTDTGTTRQDIDTDENIETSGDDSTQETTQGQDEENGNESEDRILTRSGNIGVTTSQQMIMSERELWDWNFFEQVFADVDTVLTIEMYGNNECIDIDEIPLVVPMATSTTIGGIRANKATEEMTGEIGIDENGFLHFIPGGSEYELPIANDKTLGGVKADPIQRVGANYTKVRILPDGTLYAEQFIPPEPEPYVLPVAGNELGGVKGQRKTDEDTTPVKIDENGNMFVKPQDIPEPEPYVLPVAGNELGGVKGESKTENDTVPVRIDENGNMFVNPGETPEPPDPYILPVASTEELGGIKSEYTTARQSDFNLYGGIVGDDNVFRTAIPYAHDDQTGVVRAKAKTDEQTEEVGIDVEGHLWTKPGGGGGGSDWEIAFSQDTGNYYTSGQFIRFVFNDEYDEIMVATPINTTSAGSGWDVYYATNRQIKFISDEYCPDYLWATSLNGYQVIPHLTSPNILHYMANIGKTRTSNNIDLDRDLSICYVSTGEASNVVSMGTTVYSSDSPKLKAIAVFCGSAYLADMRKYTIIFGRKRNG